MSIFSDFRDKILDLASNFTKGLFNIIDQLVHDKDLNTKLKYEIETKAMEFDNNFKMKLLENEVNVGSAFYRSWRPLLMYIVCFIMFTYGIWNNIVYPFAMMIKQRTLIKIDLDLDLIILIGYITGNYIISRTVEKIKANNQKGKKIND